MKVFRIIALPVIFLLIFHSYANAQWWNSDPKVTSRNTLYFEAGGNAGIYSLNYDRILLRKNLFSFGARGGVSFVPFMKHSFINTNFYFNNILAFPIEINCMYGKRHHAEISIGYTQVFNLYNEDIFKVYDIYGLAVFRAGYRFQRDEGGLFSRAGLLWTPHQLDLYALSNFTLGIGVGYTLKK
jgi:hypothetical protein